MVKKTIDFRDTLSSISLLKVTQVLSSMSPSDILEVRGIDADIRQDLLKVLPEGDYEVLESKDVKETDTNGFIFANSSEVKGKGCWSLEILSPMSANIPERLGRILMTIISNSLCSQTAN